MEVIRNLVKLFYNPVKWHLLSPYITGNVDVMFCGFIGFYCVKLHFWLWTEKDTLGENGIGGWFQATFLTFVSKKTPMWLNLVFWIHRYEISN